MANSSPDPVFHTGLSLDHYPSSGKIRAAQPSHPISFSPVHTEGLTPGNIISHRWSESSASNIGCFVSGTPSDYLNSSEISTLHHSTIEASTFGSNSAPGPMLPSSASPPTPAELFCLFKRSPFVMENYLEPTDHHRRSVFLQLLRETPNFPHHYECIVPRSNGTPCAKTFNRSDRGLTHIRAHLDHRPFRCEGQCGDNKW